MSRNAKEKKFLIEKSGRSLKNQALSWRLTGQHLIDLDLSFANSFWMPSRDLEVSPISLIYCVLCRIAHPPYAFLRNLLLACDGSFFLCEIEFRQTRGYLVTWAVRSICNLTTSWWVGICAAQTTTHAHKHACKVHPSEGQKSQPNLQNLPEASHLSPSYSSDLRFAIEKGCWSDRTFLALTLVGGIWRGSFRFSCKSEIMPPFYHTSVRVIRQRTCFLTLAWQPATYTHTFIVLFCSGFSKVPPPPFLGFLIHKHTRTMAAVFWEWRVPATWDGLEFKRSQIYDFH